MLCTHYSVLIMSKRGDVLTIVGEKGRQRSDRYYDDFVLAGGLPRCGSVSGD